MSYTHGVIADSGSDLIYENESGALNESLADVIAVLISCEGKEICAPADWAFAENTIFGNGVGLRDVRTPTNFTDPDTYLGTNWLTTTSDPLPGPPPNGNDNGGVHTNSGVPNKAASLLINGGDHNGVHVEPLERELVISLYEDQLISLPANAGMASAAWEAITHAEYAASAKDSGLPYFGPDWTDYDVCQVRNAWAAVRVSSFGFVFQADQDCDGVTDDLTGDNDGDGVSDQTDNCPAVVNSQYDADKDNVGDACDADKDGDGRDNSQDNCPEKANFDQKNSHGGSKGDACDDTDGDGDFDLHDNCPTVANQYQENIDGDSRGDSCDADDENDGVLDTTDNCPATKNPGQQDTDGDGVGNACDNCLNVKNSDQQNSDGESDGGNACDDDDDGDKLLDGDDNCPTVFNPFQVDLDGNGLGLECDSAERDMVEGITQGITIPGGKLADLPIGGCPKCEGTVLPERLSRMVEVRVPFPDMRVEIVDSTGSVVTRAYGAMTHTLTFPLPPTVSSTSADRPLAAVGGLSVSARESFRLRIYPSRKMVDTQPYEVRVRAAVVPTRATAAGPNDIPSLPIGVAVAALCAAGLFLLRLRQLDRN